MQMTKKEIYRRYKEAKHPDEQVQILAELNDCEASIIENIIKTAQKEEADKLSQKERKKKSAEAFTSLVLKGESVADLIPMVKYELPTEVYGALQEELTRLNEQIARLNKRYLEISTFIEGYTA